MQREAPRENSTLNHVHCILMMEKLESSRNIWSSCMEYGEPTPNLKPLCDGWRTGKTPMLYNLAVGTQVLRD